MNKTFIIAEAGVNHNGSLDLALRLVDSAANSGADAVKFQTFISEKTISINAEKADYQKKSTDSKETQLEMVKKLELSFDDFKVIANRCKEKDIIFLSTGFDIESVIFLDQVLKVPLIKIPSGDVNNAPLVLKAAQTQKDIILSTGMCEIQDIHNALAIIFYGYSRPDSEPSSFNEVLNIYEKEDTSILQSKVTILQCTTEYPTPVEDLNLRTLSALVNEFGTKVGLSDHSLGIQAPILAVALGASVIEKHFTLDRDMEGPDHQASLTPTELEEMVESIRFAEKALGSSEKKISNVESKNIKIARKSLIANCDINRGEIFTKDNLIVKRPANGINPLLYWEYIGKVINQPYREDELIKKQL